MTDEKKIRLRDCPVVREQVIRTWFPKVCGSLLNEQESDWVNAGALTDDEHAVKLKEIIVHCKPIKCFLSFLDGWEACLMSQQNEDQKKLSPITNFWDSNVALMQALFFRWWEPLRTSPYASKIYSERDQTTEDAAAWRAFEAGWTALARELNWKLEREEEEKNDFGRDR